MTAFGYLRDWGWSTLPQCLMKYFNLLYPESSIENQKQLNKVSYNKNIGELTQKD